MNPRLVVALAASLIAGAVTAAEIDPPVRLPGITHVWGDPSKLPSDSITVREIGACMGNDRSLERDFASLGKRASGLEEAFGQLKPQIDALDAERQAIEAEQAALAAEDARLAGEAADMAHSQRAIAAALRKTTRSKPEADRLNADINAYNQQVVAFNGKVAALKDRFGRSNARAEDYRRKAGATMPKVVALQEQAARYESDYGAFSVRLASFKEKCSGERRVLRQ
jgi:chromosome segregation ATPase